MKRSPILCASVVAVTAFLLTAPGAFADNSKQISDGAAKGQANERTITDSQGGTDRPGTGGQKHRRPKTYNSSHSNIATGTKPPTGGEGKSHMAVKGSGVPGCRKGCPDQN